MSISTGVGLSHLTHAFGLFVLHHLLCDKEVIVLDCFSMLSFVSIGSHLLALKFLSRRESFKKTLSDMHFKEHKTNSIPENKILFSQKDKMETVEDFSFDHIIINL